MGAKILRFSNMEDDTLRVTFSGANISDGELIPATSPVTLQMDGGGGEYSAVKYTTATVSVLCDGLQLLELYASRPLDVSVDVTNETTGELLFAGYVSPNTYNQPLTGINDTLAIECADYLGIAKYVQYKLVDETNGFSVMTLKDILKHIAHLIGADDTLLPRSVYLLNGDASKATENYELMTLSEGVFFESITPQKIDERTVSLSPNAMTCFEALEMVAESFRMFWVQVQKNIVLCDILAHSWGRCNYLSSKQGEIVEFAEQKELSEGAFSGSGGTVGILPRFSQFSVAAEPGKALEFFQPMFDDDLFTPYGRKDTYTDSNDGVDTVTLCQKLDSELYRAEKSSFFASFVTLSSPNPPVVSDSWKHSEWGDGKKWTNFLRIPCIRSNGSYSTALSRVQRFSTSVPSRNILGLKLEISAAFSSNASRPYPFDLKTNEVCSLLCVLKAISNGKTLYYNALFEKWEEISCFIELRFTEQTEWRSAFYFGAGSSDPWGGEWPWISTYKPNDIFAIGIPDGDIHFEIWDLSEFTTSANATWDVVFIKDLKLSVVPLPDIINAEAKDAVPKIVYRGVYEFDKVAETVTPPISVSSALSKRFFGTKINGEEYFSSRAPGDTMQSSGRYQCELMFMPSSLSQEMNFLDRVAALGNFGDGTEIELPLRDKHNNAITPFTAVSSSQWEGNKVVVAFSKDLAESTATVALN